MINRYLIKIIPEALQPYVTDSEANNLMLFGLSLIEMLIYLALLILIVHVLRVLNKKLFRRVRKKRGKKTHLFLL